MSVFKKGGWKDGKYEWAISPAPSEWPTNIRRLYVMTFPVGIIWQLIVLTIALTGLLIALITMPIAIFHDMWVDDPMKRWL